MRLMSPLDEKNETKQKTNKKTSQGKWVKASGLLQDRGPNHTVTICRTQVAEGHGGITSAGGRHRTLGAQRQLEEMSVGAWAEASRLPKGAKRQSLECTVGTVWPLCRVVWPHVSWTSLKKIGREHWCTSCEHIPISFLMKRCDKRSALPAP
jgi:hypothetical protein